LPYEEDKDPGEPEVKKKIPPSQIKYKQGQLLSHSLRIWLDGAVKKRMIKKNL